MKITETLQSKPITVIGIISAIHSIIYGLGFLFEAGGFQETVLYRNISMVFDPRIFGAIVLITGLGVLYGLAAKKLRLIAGSSFAQSLVWLFIFFSYAFNNELLLGCGIALVWCMISSYVAYVHANFDSVIAHVMHNYRKNP